MYNNRREVLSEALFSSFEFCANEFVDDTDDGQTFNFGKNLLCVAKTNPPKNRQKSLRPEAEKCRPRQKSLRPEAEKVPKTNPPKNCQKLLRPEAEKWHSCQKLLRPEAEK